MTLPSSPLYPASNHFSEKVCTKCRVLKPLQDFEKNMNRRSGYGPRCALCSRQYFRERDKKHAKPKPPKFNAYGEAIKVCSDEYCAYLGFPQPLKKFIRDSSRKDGFDARCKECVKRKNKRWRTANPDKVKKDRQQMLARDPNYWNVHVKAYRLRNPEAVRESKKRYRKKHPEVSIMEYTKNREKELSQSTEFVSDPLWAKRITHSCKRRAREKKVPFDMEPLDLMDRNTGLLPSFCPIFPFIKLDYKAGPNRRTWASVDRIVPQLGYVKGNVAVVSFAANLWKSDGSSTEERKRIVAIMNGRKKKKEPNTQQSYLFDDM